MCTTRWAMVAAGSSSCATAPPARATTQSAAVAKRSARDANDDMVAGGDLMRRS